MESRLERNGTQIFSVICSDCRCRNFESDQDLRFIYRAEFGASCAFMAHYVCRFKPPRTEREFPSREEEPRPHFTSFRLGDVNSAMDSAGQFLVSRDGRREQRGTVLVTGSSGLIGSAIASTAAAEGWSVRGVDRIPGNWTTHLGDLRDEIVRRAALRNVNAVVHVAALHAPHVACVPHREFWRNNVVVTRELLADAAAAGVVRFVYASSTSVYGHSLVSSESAVWVDETLPLRPRDIYDETKLAAEGLVGESGLSTLVLRIARCFPEPLMTLARHRMYRGVAISDVASSHVLSLNKTRVTGVLNIAGPLLFIPTDTEQLYSSAADVVKRRAPLVADAFAHRGWSLPNQIDRVYDSRAAAAALGYLPSQGVLELLSNVRRTSLHFQDADKLSEPVAE